MTFGLSEEICHTFVTFSRQHLAFAGFLASFYFDVDIFSQNAQASDILFYKSFLIGTG